MWPSLNKNKISENQKDLLNELLAGDSSSA